METRDAPGEGSGGDKEDGSGPLSGTFFGGDGGTVEEWLQPDNMEMPMFSLLEGPQQSAPTAVALAAAAPAAEAVTGTRVFPAVSSKGVAEANGGAVEEWLQSDNMEMSMFSLSEGPQQSAPTAVALTAAAPAAEAVTGTRVFPLCRQRVWRKRPRRQRAHHRRQYLQQRWRPAVLFSPLRRWGGRPGRPLLQMEQRHQARESSAGAVSSDAATEAAPSTGDTAAPVASVTRAARKLESAAGSSSEICGEGGASTHRFDPGTVFRLEVRYYNGSWLPHGSSSSSNSSGGSSSSSSSNDNTSSHDSWWDATCVGALLRPFDPGKRCRRSARRGKAVLGVDLPFDRGKAWRRMQHGG